MPPVNRRSVEYSQNFLTNARLVDHLLDISQIDSHDVVYEIGPGRGIITERLVERCCRVVAVENDVELAALLRRKFAARSNIRLYVGDFLDYCLPHEHYKVMANIPFNITTAIVTRLTTAPVPPDDAYLVVQKEAAERFLGEPCESLYAVLLKPWFELSIVHRFRRSDFVPKPRVDVVMFRLRKRGPPLIAQSEQQLFRDFVVYCFTTPQPSLGSTLKGIFSHQQVRQLCKTLGLDDTVTPTRMHFEQWLCLFDCFKCLGTRQAKRVVMGGERRLRQQQARLEKIHRTRVSSSQRGRGTG